MQFEGIIRFRRNNKQMRQPWGRTKVGKWEEHWCFQADSDWFSKPLKDDCPLNSKIGVRPSYQPSEMVSARKRLDYPTDFSCIL